MRKKVIALVSNNISTDQRLIKVGTSLQKNGFEFNLIGCTHTSKKDLSHIPFTTQQLNLIFKKNFVFYAELQIRHLINLIGMDTNNSILLSNDLDTLIPAKIIAKLYNIPLVVDFHEIFSELPTLKAGSYQKKTWQWLEKKLVPNLKYTMTVSDSYANFFKSSYGINPQIIRNVPFLQESNNLQPHQKEAKSNQSKILIYQGAMNYSRGIDKMILAMQYLEDVELWLVGDGHYTHFQHVVAEKKLNNKIKFLGSKKPEELKKITPLADLGLSLEEDNGLSYRYALPNKIFDYIHAQIPVLGSSDLIEAKKLIQDNQLGDVIQNHDPEHIAEKITKLLAIGKSSFQTKLIKVKKELNWQLQEKKLISIFLNAANE